MQVNRETFDNVQPILVNTGLSFSVRINKCPIQGLEYQRKIAQCFLSENILFFLNSAYVNKNSKQNLLSCYI